MAAASAWSEDLLEGASLRLAEEAARAAGITIEEWLERAIRRACSGPGETTVLPPGALAADGLVIDHPGTRRRSPRLFLLSALPLLLIGGFVWLSQPSRDTAVVLALPRQPEVAVALPPPAPIANDAEPGDPDKLASWLALRAERGDALAQYRLGSLYALGKGVEKDYVRAAPLLRAAAESGIAEAQHDYAVLCENGFGVTKDPAQAIEWYRKAAAQGYADAVLSLGYAFAKGIGTARNMSEAAQWFRRAADLGVVDAQYNLAFLYEHGEGVAKSPADAYAWYSIAALRGDQGSRQAVDRIAHDLSAQQLKDAAALAGALQKAIGGEK
jgi:Sel1 repeat